MKRPGGGAPRRAGGWVTRMAPGRGGGCGHRSVARLRRRRVRGATRPSYRQTPGRDRQAVIGVEAEADERRWLRWRRRVARWKPALSLRLPLVDGMEVLRRTEEEPRTRLIPVVVLTLSREERDLVESYPLALCVKIV
jgi:hypothetical protein